MCISRSYVMLMGQKHRPKFQPRHGLGAESHHKQMIQAIYDGVDVENGLPVLSEDVEADVAI